MIQYQHLLSPQELANSIYSYHKAPNSHETKALLEELRPTVKALVHKMKPVEMCMVLLAYTESECCDAELQLLMEEEFMGKYEAMNPSDISQFYYCFTKLGFAGDGRFYKRLQKALSKTIRAFEGPHLKLMFYRFDDEESCRLNRGVRSRLIEHCKHLMREKKLKGNDAQIIFTNTEKLKYAETKYQDWTVTSPAVDGIEDTNEKPQYAKHDLHVQLRTYLEKLRYFN